jgi:hypothetical protein
MRHYGVIYVRYLITLGYELLEYVYSLDAVTLIKCSIGKAII